MVTPRKFTGTEWRDLARGCRFLAKMDREEYEQRIKNDQSHPGRCLELEKLHLEIAELCEYWADQADRAQWLAERAERKKIERQSSKTK